MCVYGSMREENAGMRMIYVAVSHISERSVLSASQMAVPVVEGKRVVCLLVVLFVFEMRIMLAAAHWW